MLRGEPVTIDAWLRRTSARGWGPWTEAVLALGAVSGGEARWQVADPTAVGLAATHGPVDEAFGAETEIYVRPVRFRTERFWRAGGDIVVVDADGPRIEVAVPPGLADAVAERLVELRPGTTDPRPS